MIKRKAISLLSTIPIVLFFSIQIASGNQSTPPVQPDGESTEIYSLEAHFFTGLNNEHFMTLSENGSREDVTDLRLAVLQTPEEIEAMTWEDFLAEALPYAVLEEAGVVYVGTLVVPGDLNEDEEAVEAFDIAFVEEIWPAWDHQLTITYQGKIVGCKAFPGQGFQPTVSLSDYGTGGLSPTSGSSNYSPPSVTGPNHYGRASGDRASVKAVDRHNRKKNKKTGRRQRKMNRRLGIPNPLNFFVP